MDRTEYLALFMGADSESQKTEIIMAYLRALHTDVNISLRKHVYDSGYTYTITRRGDSDGWDKPFKITDEVIDALNFVKEKHEGQLRDNGSPYFKHILDVVDILIEDGSGWDDTLLAAVLHDTLEKTDATFDELKERFGDIAANTVELLVKAEGESYDDYTDRIFSDEGLEFRPLSLDISLKMSDKTNCHLKARGVILADRLANLRNLQSCGNPDKIREYIEETKRCILSRKIAPNLSNRIRSEINKLDKID